MLEELRCAIDRGELGRPGQRLLTHGRRAGVLVLCSDVAEPAVTMIVRAVGIRHAGQVAFPGGSVDPEDYDEVAAALREAHEEVGVRPEWVQVLGTMPSAGITRSGYDVTPVIGTWDGHCELTPVDSREVASVHQVSLRELINPANRVMSRHPRGHVGPAFRVGELFIWGFSGYVLDQLIARVGWEQPWDRKTAVGIPPQFRRD